MDLGKKGEAAVKNFLKQKGYQILKTNFRTRYGEIDIIAAEENTLVFIEVKTRASLNCGIPEESVNFRKQQRIRGLAMEYLLQPGRKRYRDLRFDVASVLTDKEGRVREIIILESAF